MKFKPNLYLINALIITLAIGFVTSMFLAQIHTKALHQAELEQEAAIRTFWQLLSDKGNDFRIRDGKLLAGDYVVNGNFELPDKIRAIFGGTATIFMGDTRVSTNVLKADGSRAIGTRLQGPAAVAIFKEHRSFRGETPILGIPYFTAYDPIHDRSGKIIGVLYVGVKKSDFLNSFSNLKLRVVGGTILIEVIFLVLGFVLLRQRSRQDEALRQIAGQLRLITDSVPVSIAYLDAQQRYRFANKNYGNLFGCDHTEIIGRKAAETIAEHFSELVGTNVQRAMAGNSVTFLNRIDRHGGETVHLQTSYVPHIDGNGSVLGFFIQHFDITELTRAQAALEASEKRYRTMFATTSTATFIIAADTTVTLANDEFVKLSGYTREEIEGKLSFTALLTSEYRAPLLASHNARRIDPDAAPQAIECDVRRKDGSIRRILVNVNLIPETGQSIGSFLDITERKELERALQTQLDFLQTLIDTIPSPIFYKDRLGRYLGNNKAFEAFLGLSRDKLIGKTVFDLSPPDLAAKYYAMDEELLANPGIQVYESSAVYADGNRHSVIFNKATFMNDDGTVGGLVGVILDISERKRSEEALQMSEERYRTVFATTGTAMIIIEADTTIAFANHEYVKLTGYSREEIEGKMSWTDCVVSGDRERMLDYHRQRRIDPGCVPVSYEFQLVDRIGIVRDILTTVAMIPGTGRSVQSYQDITALKQTERLLAGEKAALELIVGDASLTDVLNLLCRNVEEQAFGALCSVLLLDSSGRVLRHAAAPSLPTEYNMTIDGTRIGMNVGSCGTAAFSGEEVIVSDIATDPRWAKYWKLPLSYGLKACWSRPIRSASGTILGTFAVYYTQSRSPEPAELLLMQRATSLASIVIERKRAENALRESEERFHQIFTQNGDAIVLFSLDTFTTIDINPATEALTGYSREELLALPPTAIINAEDFNRLIDTIPLDDYSRAFQLNKATGSRKDGSTIFVSIRGKILRLGNEYVIHCSIRDTTEKIRLEDEVRNTQAKLIHTNKMTSIGMLASSVAHEINNPNNCISVNASMLTDVWNDAEPILRRCHDEYGEFFLRGLPFPKILEVAPRLFSGILEGSRRISSIVNSMKDFVREDKSGLNGSVDINQLVQNAASILWHHIHMHTDNFRSELLENLPPARGNNQQLEQVVINLLVNALQALPDKECAVSVATSFDRDAGEVIIMVRDEGLGMGEEELARLKEAFFTTRPGGTGLGLYISDSIVREHHGALEFASTPGKGTTATVRLPLLSR